MDIEKLIDQLKGIANGLAEDEFPKCANAVRQAATALSTLQAENAQLRADLEYEQEHANAYHEECGQWEAENEKLRAELEQVKRERDAAVEWLREWEKFDIYLLAHNFLIPEKWRGIQKED